LSGIESNDNPFLSLSQLFELANTVIYEPLTESQPEESDDFPALLTAAELDQQGAWSNVARLLIPGTGWEEVELDSLHSEPLQWAVSLSGARGSSGMLDIMQVPRGSPVVNEQGEVLCLLAEGGFCEAVAVKALAGDDGSCRIPYFQCGNVTWEQCNSGDGVGLCTNENSGERCNVAIVPDKANLDPLHCKDKDGCGGITCPSVCTGEDCDCIAGWGFAELPKKINVKPDGCISESTKPDDFRHSSAFLGVVIGVPVGVVVLGVVAIATMATIACKYRRRTSYVTIQS
jgi:hypothetical protein